MKMQLKTLTLISGLFMLASLLGGCATPAQIQAKHVQFERSRASMCDTAPILYTDLNKPLSAQRFMLPNGDSCPGMVRA